MERWKGGEALILLIGISAGPASANREAYEYSTTYYYNTVPTRTVQYLCAGIALGVLYGGVTITDYIIPTAQVDSYSRVYADEAEEGSLQILFCQKPRHKTRP